MIVRPYSDNDAATWDRFCAGSHQATFLHTRRFLSYHGNRFRDASLIVEEKGEWLGILPAAQHPDNAHCVASHPGLSYGGILHQGKLYGERLLEALQAICAVYAQQGYTSLYYKPVPLMYHTVPAQDDLYALFRLNATHRRSELSCAIDLAHRKPVSLRRQRGLNKARKAGVRVVSGPQLLVDFWPVLSHNLLTRHNVRPVHSLNEISLLSQRFPNEIQCICGLVGEDIVAGIVLFSTANADHTQYVAASEHGQEISALDMVLEHAIGLSSGKGKRWFDFGNSNENNGRVLNNGLHKFKLEFGGGGIIQDHFELALTTH